jgi:hypothetical protein
VSGFSPSGQGGSAAGTVADGGRAGWEEAGKAGNEMRGESGSGGDAQVDQHSTFEWGQTLPGSCRGQNFVGTFSCIVQNSIPNTRIDGTLLVDFAAPSEAQTLDAQNSTLNLLTDPVNNASLMTPVTGKATCSTRLFKGDVPPTVFTGDQVGAGFQLIIGLFCGSGAMGGTISGTLLGQLDGGTLSGQMALTIGTCACEGPFNLRAQ